MERQIVMVILPFKRFRCYACYINGHRGKIATTQHKFWDISIAKLDKGLVIPFMIDSASLSEQQTKLLKTLMCEHCNKDRT